MALIAVVVLCAAAGDVRARVESKGNWIVLNNCQLIANPANDGDSFHVSAGGREYLFRLYLVDAPETDEMVPRRLVDQANYFGITVPQAIEIGRAAKTFTEQKLSQPFTVFTHMSDAMGRSRLERFYAFVQTKDGDLGEQLVRNGMARIYGYKAAPPGSANSRMELEKLQQLENQAKRDKLGGWNSHANGLATPQPPPVIPVSTVRSRPSISPRAAEPTESHRKSETPRGTIDINTATEKELMTVPGIGRATADDIVAARPFHSADDLQRVKGIGAKRYARMRPYFQ